MDIVKIQDLESSTLKEYIVSRCISVEVASLYCKEHDAEVTGVVRKRVGKKYSASSLKRKKRRPTKKAVAKKKKAIRKKK